MKKLLFILLIWFSLGVFAQDKIFVHTATAANINPVFPHITYLDHPDINGNPNAPIVYKHVWNPNGTTGVFNNNIDGLYYDNVNNRWAIYNEDRSPMVVGAKFFVYIASNPTDVFTHVATVANQNPASAIFTAIGDIDLSSFPGPYAVMSNYFNSHTIYNPYNYGFFYDDTYGTNTRNIYNEDLTTNIPTNAAFRILKYGHGTLDRFTAESTTANITGFLFVIDNPILNNNPNATFVFQHYWKVTPTATASINKVLGAVYIDAASRWAIYTEDQSPMPVGVGIDIIVAAQDTAGVNDIVSETNVSLQTNPVQDVAKIFSEEKIKKVMIYNLLGQKVREINQNFQNINVASLSPGTYVLKVELENGKYKNIKMLKQ